MAHKPPIIALVVAMGENGAIGKGGDLPWHLHSDMRYFRKVTMGKPIIMGRRTFESLQRAARRPPQHRAHTERGLRCAWRRQGP